MGDRNELYKAGAVGWSVVSLIPTAGTTIPGKSGPGNSMYLAIGFDPVGGGHCVSRRSPGRSRESTETSWGLPRYAAVAGPLSPTIGAGTVTRDCCDDAAEWLYLANTLIPHVRYVDFAANTPGKTTWATQKPFRGDLLIMDVKST